jgi:predicted metal-binding protein
VTDWIDKAKEAGFDVAAPLDPQTLTAREDVREMCAVDKCGFYNKNWTCPPHCGTLEECQHKMRSYPNGVLLQTIGHRSKPIDSKAYRETQQRHMKNFNAFIEEIRKEYPDALCLGAGGCQICKECTFPEPCRFPKKATSSMEGYGLFVTQVCKDAGLPYYYGPKTIMYIACVLY